MYFVTPESNLEESESPFDADTKLGKNDDVYALFLSMHIIITINVIFSRQTRSINKEKR